MKHFRHRVILSIVLIFVGHRHGVQLEKTWGKHSGVCIIVVLSWALAEGFCHHLNIASQAPGTESCSQKPEQWHFVCTDVTDDLVLMAAVFSFKHGAWVHAGSWGEVRGEDVGKTKSVLFSNSSGFMVDNNPIAIFFYCAVDPGLPFLHLVVRSFCFFAASQYCTPVATWAAANEG